MSKVHYVSIPTCSCAPTKVVDGMTPIECWSGVKPDVSVFHTFRCKYFKVKCGKIKKFAFRITQYTYLGPVAREDRYHLDNEAIKCMISSHDVVFHENIFKVSNEHTTFATSSYVRSDTIFIDNSTSAQLDDIEDDLTNWTSPGCNQCEEATQHRICSE
jgi:hypothetical protein